MSKKKVSASTLIRMAAKAKTKKEAQRLRAKAAKLRRDAREAAAYAESLRAEMKKVGGMAGKGTALAHAEANLARQAKGTDLVWRAKQVGGAMLAKHDAANDSNAATEKLPPHRDPNRVEELINLAKSDPDTFRMFYRTDLAHTRIDTERSLNDIHSEQSQAQREANDISIISAFIAKTNTVARANGGPLPPAVVVDGLSIAKVVDALKAGGYTENGRRGTWVRGR